MGNSLSPARNDHPSRDNLYAFSVGNLPDDLLESIGRHLDECPECVEVLRTLDDNADPLIARARKPIPPEWLGAPPSGNEVGSGAAEKPTPSAIRQAGRFCIEGEIGTGGMGVVYRAFDPDIRRSVAVKELQERHFGRRPDLEYRFLEEAQL